MLGELNSKEIEDLLSSEATGRIGCHAEGRTYVVPITYAYDGRDVYCHSPEGLKLRMMRKNPVVCFEVDRIQDMGNWKSVIVHGRFEELRGRDALAAMDILIKRFVAIEQPDEPHPSYIFRESQVEPPRTDGREVVIFRIRIAEKSGRFETTTNN